MEIQEESQNSRRNRVQVKQGKGRGWKGRGRKEGCVATRATAESQYDSPVRV